MDAMQFVNAAQQGIINRLAIPERLLREMQEGGQNYAATRSAEQPGPYVLLSAPPIPAEIAGE